MIATPFVPRVLRLSAGYFCYTMRAEDDLSYI